MWRTAKASSREALGEERGGDSQLSLVKARDLVRERWCNGGATDATLAWVRNARTVCPCCQASGSHVSRGHVWMGCVKRED